MAGRAGSRRASDGGEGFGGRRFAGGGREPSRGRAGVGNDALPARVGGVGTSPRPPFGDVERLALRALRVPVRTQPAPLLRDGCRRRAAHPDRGVETLGLRAPPADLRRARLAWHGPLHGAPPFRARAAPRIGAGGLRPGRRRPGGRSAQPARTPPASGARLPDVDSFRLPPPASRRTLPACVVAAERVRARSSSRPGRAPQPLPQQRVLRRHVAPQADLSDRPRADARRRDRGSRRSALRRPDVGTRVDSRQCRPGCPSSRAGRRRGPSPTPTDHADVPRTLLGVWAGHRRRLRRSGRDLEEDPSHVPA